MREGSSSERLEGVELLRFVLAFGVVIYHYYYFGPHMRLIALPPIDGIGLDALMFGVEAFFAVSGLVILISTARRSAIDFLIARIARLGPTLLVASSFTLLVYYLLRIPPDLSGIGLKYLVSITFFPLVRLSGGLDPSLWSLSFEIRFYILVFALMLFVNVRDNALRIAIVLLAYDATRLLAPLVFGASIPTRLDVLRDYAPFFALGILLYHRHTTKGAGRVFMSAMIVSFTLGSIRCTQLLEQMDNVTLRVGHIHYWQGLLIESGIVVAMILSVRCIRSARLAAFCRTAGRASYPLYVAHQLCGYWVVNFLWARVHVSFDPRPLVVVAMVLLALLFGNTLEPRLIAAYRRLLHEAAGTLSSLMPKKLTLALARPQ